MTPYEPRHEKTCLGTDHLIFWGGGGERAGDGFFPQDFLPIEKQRFVFLTVRELKYFFQDKAKTFFFSKQHICSNTFVYFLNPIYMGILFICSCIHVSLIFGSESK